MTKRPGVGSSSAADAADDLWERRNGVRGAVGKLLRDAASAEDVAQEAVLRALDHDEAGAHLERWLAVVSRRLAIDELRARQRVRPVAVLPDRPATGLDDPVEEVLRNERMLCGRRALAALGRRERTMLVEQALEGMTVAALARRHQTTPASVRSTLNRARAKLREATAPSV